MLDVKVSFPLAFLAGLVSFLSPCILPVVPSYLAFVSGLTLEELQSGESVAGARRRAVLHTVLFGIGFGLVFMTLGAGASAAGQAFNRALPWVTRAGGLVVVLFGLHLAGALRIPALAREVRLDWARRPAGPVGSLLVGVAFGAAWTPCVGPVLASILLYAGFEGTVARGTLLLGTYGLGLAVPFVGSALAFNWFMAGRSGVRRWLVPLERGAGAVLLVVGFLMVTGRWADLNRFLAGLGQLVHLEM